MTRRPWLAICLLTFTVVVTACSSSSGSGEAGSGETGSGEAGSGETGSAETSTSGVSAPRASFPPGGGAKPVVVDYSPTVSDVGALLYLLSHADVEVLAVTVPVTGEAGCDLGLDVTIGILAMFGREDVPVACDPEVPTGAGAWPTEFLAGHEGLAVGLPPSDASADERPAHQLIADMVAGSDEPVTLYAVAPLTNVARTLELHPEVASGLEQIVIMGGAVDVPGNVEGGHAEWNLWVDVPAAETVLASGTPVTLVPLDATNDVPVPDSWQVAFDSVSSSEPIDYLGGLVATFPAVTSGFFYLWDELAAAVAAGEDVVETETIDLVVVTETGPEFGSTKRDPAGAPVTVTMRVGDPDGFYAHFLETVAGTPVEVAAAPAESPDPGGVSAAVLEAWLEAAIAGDVQAAAGLLAPDVEWIGPVGASPDAFITGSVPYEGSLIEAVCGSSRARASCEVSWRDLWIDAIPELEQGRMRVDALVEDGRIAAFEEWIYADDVVAAFAEHFAWLEVEYPEQLAEACAEDSGAAPCSQLVVDTVDEWLTTRP